MCVSVFQVKFKVYSLASIFKHIIVCCISSENGVEDFCYIFVSKENIEDGCLCAEI